MTKYKSGYDGMVIHTQRKCGWLTLAENGVWKTEMYTSSVINPTIYYTGWLTKKIVQCNVSMHH